VVGLLALKTVDECLAKKAELVIDAVAESREAHGRHRVEEAGRQAAETTVAESRVRLSLFETPKLFAELSHFGFYRRPLFEVHQVVGQ
jgi:hypothetical protein